MLISDIISIKSARSREKRNIDIDLTINNLKNTERQECYKKAPDRKKKNIYRFLFSVPQNGRLCCFEWLVAIFSFGRLFNSFFNLNAKIQQVAALQNTNQNIFRLVKSYIFKLTCNPGMSFLK